MLVAVCAVVTQRTRNTCRNKERNAFFLDKYSLILIAYYAIKPYIPRIWRNFLDFLTLKRYADQLRTKPVSAMPEKRETAVVITATHADSVSITVECDGRCNGDVEFLWRDQKAPSWLPNTEVVLLKFRFRTNFAEEHLMVVAQNWNKNALVCAPCGFNDRARVDFVMHRQVTTDERAREEFA